MGSHRLASEEQPVLVTSKESSVHQSPPGAEGSWHHWLLEPLICLRADPPHPRAGPHLVLLLQVPHGTQALAVVLGSSQGQLLLHPGHLLIGIPEELQEEAPGLQSCSALPQGLL